MKTLTIIQTTDGERIRLQRHAIRQSDDWDVTQARTKQQSDIGRLYMINSYSDEV